MDRGRPLPSLALLGVFRVEREGCPDPVPPSAQRVLAALAVRGAMPRIDIAGLLWPDLPPARSLANLRMVLWRLRREAPDLLQQDGRLLRLVAAEVDLDEVRAWAQRSLSIDGPCVAPPAGAACELLPGWGDDWLIEPREELRLMQLYALETCARRLLTACRLGEAAGLALRALSLDPLRESANRLLIEVHVRDGNVPDALRQFRRYRELLQRELGARPSRELEKLMDQQASLNRLRDG
jgi:DNA-binding SARP family transcriptional activator